MKQRCLNKRATNYSNYGGRGITICQRWIDSFKNFISDMGRRPTSKHSIERKNNNIGYSKRNCIWALRKVQNNNRRDNRIIRYKGQLKTLAQWSSIVGINYETLRNRLISQSPEVAFSTPVGQKIPIENILRLKRAYGHGKISKRKAGRIAGMSVGSTHRYLS